jgi:hypothetical protein
MRRMGAAIVVLVMSAALLSACAQKISATGAIERYLKAKVSGDENKLVSLSCKAWEAQAALDAAPFQSVQAEINGLTCKESGKDGAYTLVTCDGTLVIQYRGESPREQSLSGTTYRATKEAGEWKMCGEQ